ncbi:threonylcarbamoyl-AMP synthase [Candidatus Kaiserbacteria bacterium]|nr:threonylcarbamoyl-AMP synthase [Candidatus Kaiserbacteria bacterium]
MEVIQLSDVGIETSTLRAAEVLRARGVVLYPTDTLYGLGADALSDEAVAKVRNIKGREEGKPIHCIVADLAMAGKYADVNDSARLLAKEFFPGPLTLVLKRKQGVDMGIARGVGTIGVRVSKNDFCIALAREFGKPYTTTSANVSGEVSERSVQKILTQLGESAKQIDLVIDAGELPPSLPSTVVGVRGQDVVILREGAIPASDIYDVLGWMPREREGL